MECANITNIRMNTANRYCKILFLIFRDWTSEYNIDGSLQENFRFPYGPNHPCGALRFRKQLLNVISFIHNVFVCHFPMTVLRKSIGVFNVDISKSTTRFNFYQTPRPELKTEAFFQIFIIIYVYNYMRGRRKTPYIIVKSIRSSLVSEPITRQV